MSFLLLMTISSCQKENLKDFKFDGVTNSNGLLVFEDSLAFQRIYDDLKSSYGSEKGQRFIPLLDKHECKPTVSSLSEFEEALGFSSARRNYEEVECQVLNDGGSPDEIPYPLEPDLILQTFFNEDHQIQIGRRIYYRKSEDILLTVTDGNRQTLAQLTEGVNPLLLENVDIQSGSKTTDLCEADFTYETTCSNQIVTFTLQGTGIPPGGVIKWTFGDGNTSQAMNPVHNYGSNGQYIVLLQVCDLQGEVCCTSSQTVSVGTECNAKFKFSKGPQGIVSFTDYSTTCPGSNIISWEWNFGDGGTSTLQNPSHTYICNSFADVTLTIETDDGCTDTKKREVDITSLKCCQRKGKDGWHQAYNPGNTEYIKYKIHRNLFTNIENFHRVKASLKYYAYNDDCGKWERGKSPLEIVLNGNVFTSEGECNCENPYSVNGVHQTNGSQHSFTATVPISNKFHFDRDFPINVLFKAGGIIKSHDMNVSCD